MPEPDEQQMAREAMPYVGAAVGVGAIGMAATGPIQYLTAVVGIVLIFIGIKKGGLHRV